MKRHKEQIERIGEIPLFETCTTRELALIAGLTTEHRATAGDVLIRSGEVGREFFVIIDGTAAVMIDGQLVAKLGPGDFAGEIALLDWRRRSATVVASTDLTALVSTRAEFSAMIAEVPSVSRKLLAGLAGRLRTADRARVDSTTPDRAAEPEPVGA